MIIIERFEGDIAVLETDDAEYIQISRTELPAGAREGDVLDFHEQTVVINEEETRKLREKITERIRKIKEKSQTNVKTDTEGG